MEQYVIRGGNPLVGEVEVWYRYTQFLKNCYTPLIPDHLCEKRCKCETINSKQNKIKLDAETSR